MKTLSQEIFEFRAKNKISLRKFAKMCNVTLQTAWNIENDRTKNPTKTTVYRIRQVLDNEVT